MPTGSQPTAAPPPAMAQRHRGGSAGIDRRQLRAAATYYRAFSLAPPPAPFPVPVAAGGDSARRSPSPDIEDPPPLVDLPAPGRAPPPPPAAHVPPPLFLQGRLDFLRRQSAPPEEAAGRRRRRRRQADDDDEGSSERRPPAAAARPHHRLLASTYYRALPLAPPPPVAVVGDSSAPARSPSSDIEDPPQLGLPLANPSRGGGDPAPPPAHVPGAAGGILRGRLDLVPPPLVRRQRAPPPPLEEDEGPSRRRQADDDEEGSSERRDAHAPQEEIYEALRAIPGLARDDMLRAYSKFLRDDRQFRSLMALPGDMRKDWLLMEMRNGQ